MWVESLGLLDFRNYEQVSLEFDPGLNLVIGPNAQGKTNLLESICCLSGLGSPRGSDAVLVREGRERAVVHGRIHRGARELDIDVEFRTGKGTRALVNKTAVPSIRSLAEVFTCVFFGPDELALVKGSPESRRRFLDDVAVKLRPMREGQRRAYERVLKQRNALLKSAPRGLKETSGTLEVWDESLARAGAALTRARLESLATLIPFARKRYESVAGGGRLDLSYVSTWLDEAASADALEAGAVAEDALFDALLASIAAVRTRELERGMTLVGPHRDDMSIGLVSAGTTDASLLDARAFASQGDQRTCALALKLGEFDLLSDALGEEPVLLLDDVFSELDPDRRTWLADSVRTAGQTFVSSAEPDAIGSAAPARAIEIREGKIVES